MTIAIQASDLDAERIDGTRVYALELLKRFGELDKEQTFALYHRRRFNPLLTPPSFPNYQIETKPFPVAWMQTRFAFEMFREKPEKVFLPIQAAPLFLPKDTEVTVTVHDLAFKRYPETFPRTHLWKLNALLDVALGRADKIIAVSQSTKDDLLEYVPSLSEKNVRVIHHGFDAHFFGTKLDLDVVSEKLRRYTLEIGNYCLYVGALQPRKNVVRLIAAFEEAKKSVSEMKLVLAGEVAWLADDILAAREKSPYRDDILLTGRVTFDELRVLYQGARMFAFPSLYEGFGLPILEAFASDVPVLTASNSSLREVAGKAALYVNAESVDDIAEKLARLWDEETLRETLVIRGREQLVKFSWDKCAAETLAYIKE